MTEPQPDAADLVRPATSAIADALRTTKCWRCRGDGYFFRVPDGFNPFYAGGFRTAEASRRVECFTCNGTGRSQPQSP